MLDNGSDPAAGKPSFLNRYIEAQALQQTAVTRCLREGSQHTGEEAEYKI